MQILHRNNYKILSTFITDPKGKEEILNKQFDQEFSEEKVYAEDNIKKKIRLEDIHHPEMPDISITKEGVRKLSSNLDASKAPGPDGMAPRVLKELADDIAPSLTAIFQRLFATGKVPKCWKLAHVSSI